MPPRDSWRPSRPSKYHWEALSGCATHVDGSITPVFEGGLIQMMRQTTSSGRAQGDPVVVRVDRVTSRCRKSRVESLEIDGEEEMRSASSEILSSRSPATFPRFRHALRSRILPRYMLSPSLQTPMARSAIDSIPPARTLRPDSSVYPTPLPHALCDRRRLSLRATERAKHRRVRTPRTLRVGTACAPGSALFAPSLLSPSLCSLFALHCRIIDRTA